MKTHYLFPNSLKKIGWMLLALGVIMGLYYVICEAGPDFLDWKVFSMARKSVFGKPVYFEIVQNNIFDELIGLLLITGALLVAFSREKTEDELIRSVRLESLVWATYVNHIILILAIVFVYDISFYWILVFNMFTMLIFFIIRFNWVICKMKKQLQDEE